MLRSGLSQPAALPVNEERRLEFLDKYRLWHTPPDAGLDRLTRIAAEHFQVPTALISLVGRDQQWFKSRVGLAACGTSRDVSFCAHTILGSDVLVVPDAREDPRFMHNSLVTGAPWIRFYAGAPLEVDPGVRLGSFCLIDYQPRPHGFTPRDASFLKELAALAVGIFDQYLNRSLFEFSPAPIYVSDLEKLSVLNCNSSAADLFGYTRAELEEMRLADLFEAGSCPDAASLEHQASSPEHSSKPQRYRAKDGKPILALVTSRKLLYLGRPAVMSILTDITEITETQEKLRLALHDAEAAVLAKRQLLATVSHELRTPLNHIIGMATLLSSTDLSNEQREYTQTIEASGHHLEAMVGGLLEYTRLGSRVPKPTTFSPDSVLTAARTKWLSLCSEKGIALEVTRHSPVPPKVIGDLAAVTGVLDRLIANAVKFTLRGKVQIELTLIHKPGAAPLLEFCVIDSGIGISPEFAPQIFQPFVQEDSSNTRQFEGIGLGLALCKRILDRLNGSIDFTSSKASGSRFWFRVPVQIIETSR